MSDFRPDLKLQSFLLTLARDDFSLFLICRVAHPIKRDAVKLVHKVLEWIVPLAHLSNEPLKNFRLLSQLLIVHKSVNPEEDSEFDHLQIFFALVAAEEEVAVVEATLVVQLPPFSPKLLTIRAPACR